MRTKMKIPTLADLLVILCLTRKVGKRVYFGVKRIALQLGKGVVFSIGYKGGRKIRLPASPE
jgi:hypothetical protein